MFLLFFSAFLSQMFILVLCTPLSSNILTHIIVFDLHAPPIFKSWLRPCIQGHQAQRRKLCIIISLLETTLLATAVVVTIVIPRVLAAPSPLSACRQGTTSEAVS